MADENPVDTIAERAKRLIESTGITVAAYHIEVQPDGTLLIKIYGGGIIRESQAQAENTLPQPPTTSADLGPEQMGTPARADPPHRRKRKP